jgi:hypothetical protein
MFQVHTAWGKDAGSFTIKTPKGIVVEVCVERAFGSDLAEIHLYNSSDIPISDIGGYDQTVADLIQILLWANSEARTGYEVTHSF